MVAILRLSFFHFYYIIALFNRREADDEVNKVNFRHFFFLSQQIFIKIFGQKVS